MNIQNEKIIKITEFLLANNLEKEAEQLFELFKTSNPNSSYLEKWESILSEIDAPYVDPNYEKLEHHLKQGTAKLKRALKLLQSASPDDIRATLESPILKRMLSQNKRAYSLGSALKFGIPLISILFALKDFYYCSVEYSKLMSEMPDAGLYWFESLMPNKIMMAVDKNKQKPEVLRKITKATKTSKIFAEQAIYLIGDSSDAIKDIVFLIAEFGTGGLIFGIDIGISFLIMILTYVISSNVDEQYDKILEKVQAVATKQINDLKINQFNIESKNF